MRAIINEVSGERPLQTVLEMVPYPRVRPRAEYEGRFRESEVMARLAKEYGFSDVEIEVFPQPNQRLWQATQAELWLAGPEPRKLYDFRDVAVAIASGSESGDVTAELVDVGNGGRAEDYAGKDVKGKIVLGSASSSQLQRLAMFERGAVGVLSYNPIHPDADSDQIGSQSISAPRRRARRRASAGRSPRASGANSPAAWRAARRSRCARSSRRSRSPVGWRPCTRSSPATAAPTRSLRCRATCTRATSSRARTTTTPAAR